LTDKVPSKVFSERIKSHIYGFLDSLREEVEACNSSLFSKFLTLQSLDRLVEAVESTDVEFVTACFLAGALFEKNDEGEEL
jgi:hypothetical protein